VARAQLYIFGDCLRSPSLCTRQRLAMAASLHGDVAAAIGQQVEQMIVQAQKDSEARVKQELGNARMQLQTMEGEIKTLSERVTKYKAAKQSGLGRTDGEAVDMPYLNQRISQLEVKWGSEVKALKQDLHRTILAHNHNSDLMRHHRDALDEARRKLDSHAQPKAEQVDAQIDKVDRMLRAGLAKQRALDALTERLATLEVQVEAQMPGAHMPGYPGMMPGMQGMPGMAGMGMPPGMEPREVAPPSKSKAKKEEAKASQNAETSFNTEAPVFIPRGATSPDEPIKLSAPAGLEVDTKDGEEDVAVLVGATSVAAVDLVEAKAEVDIEE